MDFHVLEVMYVWGGCYIKKKALSGYSSFVAFIDPEVVSSVFLTVSGCARFT